MIAFDKVHFQYEERPVLSELSLTLPQGSFHFLTGASGSGKSTLLKLCSGELLPVKGEVRIFDAPTDALSRDQISRLRRRIGHVHQEALFVEHLSVLENVLLPVVAAGLNAGDARKNVEDLLDWVGLGALKHDSPEALSGGEKQRVALARAVILSPDIILADEPTGNIDPQMGARLLGLLIQLNSHGKTILIATHDLTLIRHAKNQLNTRTLRLDHGRVEMAGSEL